MAGFIFQKYFCLSSCHFPAKSVQNACNEYVDKCLAPSVAVGIAVKENVEEYLSQIFSDAEYEMFENKMNMKKAPGYQERLRRAL